MVPAFHVEGHAILSDEGHICDNHGDMPAALMRPSDFRYFQDHLDAAAIVVTGRNGHESHPNKPGRQRLVFTSRCPGFERHGDVTFFNPASARLADALHAIAPAGGVVAVTGGQPVFRLVCGQWRL